MISDTIVAAQLSNLAAGSERDQCAAGDLSVSRTVQRTVHPAQMDDRHHAAERPADREQHGHHQRKTPPTLAAGDFNFADIDGDTLIA